MHTLKYYNYDESMQTPTFGMHRLPGDAIKPQFWPKDHNNMNQNIAVVVGSGAPAIPSLPHLAEDARHVIMLQRSPIYISTLPMSGEIPQAHILVITHLGRYSLAASPTR